MLLALVVEVRPHPHEGVNLRGTEDARVLEPGEVEIVGELGMDAVKDEDVDRREAAPNIACDAGRIRVLGPDEGAEALHELDREPGPRAGTSRSSLTSYLGEIVSRRDCISWRRALCLQGLCEWVACNDTVFSAFEGGGDGAAAPAGGLILGSPEPATVPPSLKNGARLLVFQTRNVPAARLTVGAPADRSLGLVRRDHDSLRISARLTHDGGHFSA